ncbi:MAG: nuclear transport factor 2 family protein [Pseudomonadota bacterium]
MYLIACLFFAFPALAQSQQFVEDAHLKDRALIADQLARYSQLWDRKDSDGVVQLVAEDGAFEWHLTGAEKQPPVVRGRENILRYAKQAHGKRLAGKQSRHHFSGLVFEELTADEAVTEHMMLVTHVIPGQKPVVAATGIYKINWKKSENGWLMTHRKLYVDR